MVKRPTEPFWDASHHTHARKSTLKDPLELNPPRDKDNADHAPKPPSFAQGSRPNQAARGAMGYKTMMLSERIAVSNAVDITKGDPETDLWIHGKITSMEGYRFAAKVYDLPSQHGIDGGHISKLQIWKDEQSVAAYDRGWNVKPANARDLDAVTKVRAVFDPPERDFKPIMRGRDKDRGHER